jgi:hypothetical protein
MLLQRNAMGESFVQGGHGIMPFSRNSWQLLGK